MRRPFQLTPAGWAMFLASATLSLIGVATIYVTDTHYALGDDGPANAVRQLIRIGMGLGLGMILLHIGYQPIGRFAYGFFIVTTLLLIPLLIAKEFNTSFGGLMRPRNGAYRWIQLPGILLQPSELMKMALVLALAWYLRYRSNFKSLTGLLVPFLAAGVPLVLVLLEPDLGTSLLFIPVLFVMLFVAGARALHLGIIAGLALIVAPFTWNHIEPYQRLRITAVLLQSDELRRDVMSNPEKFTWLATRRQAQEWAASSGYQLVHSKNALGSGGPIGNGWGRGTYVDNPLLPDRHNDFVFSMIGHQWGFAGCMLVLLCFTVIVIAGARIASQTIEPFARLLAVGIITLLASQAIVNMAMTIGLLPVTGMTLPFVSYGGSAVICNYLAISLLISIARHRPYLLTRDPFVFGREQTEMLSGDNKQPVGRAPALAPG